MATRLDVACSALPVVFELLNEDGELILGHGLWAQRLLKGLAEGDEHLVAGIREGRRVLCEEVDGTLQVVALVDDAAV